MPGPFQSWNHREGELKRKWRHVVSKGEKDEDAGRAETKSMLAQGKQPLKKAEDELKAVFIHDQGSTSKAHSSKRPRVSVSIGLLLSPRPIYVLSRHSTHFQSWVSLPFPALTLCPSTGPAANLHSSISLSSSGRNPSSGFRREPDTQQP